MRKPPIFHPRMPLELSSHSDILHRINSIRSFRYGKPNPTLFLAYPYVFRTDDVPRVSNSHASLFINMASLRAFNHTASSLFPVPYTFARDCLEPVQLSIL